MGLGDVYRSSLLHHIVILNMVVALGFKIECLALCSWVVMDIIFNNKFLFLFVFVLFSDY